MVSILGIVIVILGMHSVFRHLDAQGYCMYMIFERGCDVRGLGSMYIPQSYMQPLD